MDADNPTPTIPQCSLIEAIQGNDINEVAALIKAGADVNQRIDNISTPLYRAAAIGNEDIVDALLKAGADKDYVVWRYTPIAIAVGNNHPEVITRLLEAGVDINQTVNGETLLHMAIHGSALDSIRVLLAHGIDINARNYDNRTPLQLAHRSYPANYEHKDEIVQLLKSAEQTLVKPARST